MKSAPRSAALSPARPWYREPWPWLLMVGPAAVIVAGVITAWLAVRSSDGLVEDDYYKQGLAVNQIIQRDREAVERGLSGALMLGSDGQQLRLHLVHRTGPVPGATVRLHAMHPTRAGEDRVVMLERGSDGLYAGSLSLGALGRRRIVVDEPGAGWRLVGDWNPDVSGSVTLLPAAEATRQ